MNLKKEDGQTAVEYVLLLMVVVVLIVNVMGIVRERFLGDPEKCDEANKKSIACLIAGKLKPDNWKYFSL